MPPPVCRVCMRRTSGSSSRRGSCIADRWRNTTSGWTMVMLWCLYGSSTPWIRRCSTSSATMSWTSRRILSPVVACSLETSAAIKLCLLTTQRAQLGNLWRHCATSPPSSKAAQGLKSCFLRPRSERCDVFLRHDWKVFCYCLEWLPCCFVWIKASPVYLQFPDVSFLAMVHDSFDFVFHLRFVVTDLRSEFCINVHGRVCIEVQSG